MPTVFVTGSTGVLGRATIPQLLAAGFTVRALSRNEPNDATIRALGAEPVRGDLFDQDSLACAMDSAEAVLHLATRIPPSSKLRDRSAWIENDRIRAQGTKNLVDVAFRIGVRVFVYPSFAFVYPESDDKWIDATTAPVDPIDILRSTIAAEHEVARFAARGDGERRGIALRLGGLYGTDLPSTIEQVRMAQRGISMFGATPNAFTPMLWIDDAAAALVVALERGPSGLYDIVDDEPLRQSQVKKLLAAAAGRRRLLSLPGWLVQLMAGPAGGVLTRSLRISNRRFKEATGWRPAVSSAENGFARITREYVSSTRKHVPMTVRSGLLLMALFGLLAGVQQQFAPRSFYDNFPGFGLHWVSVDGPYNEHLLRDLGGANLTLVVVTLFAIARPTTGLVRAVAGATLVAQIPHFIYHAAHLDIFSSMVDRVLQTAALSATLLIPLLVIVTASGIGRQRRPTPAQPSGLEAAEASSRHRLFATSN